MNESKHGEPIGHCAYGMPKQLLKDSTINKLYGGRKYEDIQTHDKHGYVPQHNRPQPFVESVYTSF